MTTGEPKKHASRQVIGARMVHVDQMHKLITGYAERNRMLFRGLEDLYEHIRDFRIYVDGSGVVVGCCALEVLWRDLAEVKSLAVARDHQGKGIGRALVAHAVAEASRLGIPQVFALTYELGFFKRLGFREVPKQSLPHKVWTDCIRCPLQNDCREGPVLLDLAAVPPDC